MTHPWRNVVTSHLGEGSSNALNRAGGRTSRWWELDLDCGHTVERSVSYIPRERASYSRARRGSDIKEAPSRVRCERCCA